MSNFELMGCKDCHSLNGSHLEDVKPNKKHLFIIENLINHSLKKQTKAFFPQFIMDCFEAFIQNKKQIIFDLHQLDKPYEHGNRTMNDFMHLFFHNFHSLNRREHEKDIERNDEDFTNLPKSDILSVFPNAKTLIMQITNSMYSYSLSFMAILNVICQCNFNEIILKSKQWKNGYDWLNTMWRSKKNSLKKAFGAKNYQISMKEEIITISKNIVISFFSFRILIT